MCKSARELAGHLAGTEMWFLDAVINRRFREGDSLLLPGLNARNDVARWYDENFSQRIPRLEALSGEDLATPVDFIGILKDPAVTYLSVAIRHSVHHRGAALGVSAAYGCEGSGRFWRIYLEEQSRAALTRGPLYAGP
jgi:hypothetical protein